MEKKMIAFLVAATAAAASFWIRRKKTPPPVSPLSPEQMEEMEQMEMVCSERLANYNQVTALSYTQKFWVLCQCTRCRQSSWIRSFHTWRRRRSSPRNTVSPPRNTLEFGSQTSCLIVADNRASNFLPHGTSVDSTQRDARRPEGVHDKKEWRRNLPDVENSCHWHDEERETGLLCRRDRRKEGDRENEYRKSDRRPEVVSMRDTADSSPLPSSDRWNEVPGRNSGYESKRDSNPEDKEKDPRVEKMTDGDKEDTHAEKQSGIGGSRPMPESESRDTWKLRHCQDSPPLCGSSSSGPLGAVPAILTGSLVGRSSISVNTLCYPRAKILDIYRKNKFLPSPCDSKGFVEVPQITQPSSLPPLAFVKPDSEETEVLETIWKGKVKSSEDCDSHTESMGTVSACKIEPNFDVGECEDMYDTMSTLTDPAGVTLNLLKDDPLSNAPDSPKKADKANVKNSADFLDSKMAALNYAPQDIVTKLPGDSNSLFSTSFIQETLDSDGQHQDNHKREPEERTVDLRLLYQDPQGQTQGPFSVVHILSWYDQGFFGSDLPVRLLDAPEGTGFQSLGELMSNLSLRSNLEANASIPFTLNGEVLHPSRRDDPFNQTQQRLQHEVSSQMPQFSQPEIFGGVADAQRHEFSVQDAEGVLYMGRTVNSTQTSGMLASDIHDLPQTFNNNQGLQTGHPNFMNYKVLTYNDSNPLGLSWSSNGRGNASSNILHDAFDGSLSHFEPDINNLTIEDHFLSQNFQKQHLKRQHLMPSHQNQQLNASYLEHLHGPSYQQQSVIRREHMLKLQVERQQRLQQLEQEEQLHQQHELHRRMQLLQQQHQHHHQQQHQQRQQHQLHQQRQQHQLLLEQLLHHKLQDANYGVPHVDPLLGENSIDQILYRQQLLHVRSLDQLIQAKLGHNLQHQNELLEALNHPGNRHMLTLEEQYLLDLQQEQIQSRRFPVASRQQPIMDEERHVGGAWSIDESGQFISAPFGHHTRSGRPSQLDFVQPLQRNSYFEQPAHFDRNFLLYDRIQKGTFGLNSESFERSAGTPRPDMDIMNTFARLQGMDLQERYGWTNSPGQMGQLSGNRPQQNWMANQIHAPHLDAMERNWSEQQLGFAHSKGVDMSRERVDISDLKDGVRVKQHGSKIIALNKSGLDSLEGGRIDQTEVYVDHGALKNKLPVRHASFGVAGGGTNLYNYDMGPDCAYVDPMASDRMSGIYVRNSDGSLSSQGVSSELVKRLNSDTCAYSDEMRHEGGGHLPVSVSESSSSGKDFSGEHHHAAAIQLQHLKLHSWTC